MEQLHALCFHFNVELGYTREVAPWTIQARDQGRT